MSVCLPDYSKINCTTDGATGTVYNAISSANICTGDAALIKEARFSVSSF